MSQHFDMVVIIPIGPNTEPDFVIDTIESLNYYTRCLFKIILVDDSQTDVGKAVKHRFTDVDLIRTEKSNGRNGGLYLTLCFGYRYAIENYVFKVLFKVDTDALIIGDQPQQEALDLFEKNAFLGLAGQYGIQYDGQPWDIDWPKARIIAGTSTWRYFHRPLANWNLTKHYKKALLNGYKTGESVFGGSYFISQFCLWKLFKEGLLPDKRLGALSLEEDHIFSLLVKSVNLELADLSAGSLPFACSWRGLPDAPENLFNSGKKIIHSTRYWEKLNEKQIREYFQRKRQTAN